jgi:hypothetical protein
MLKNTDQVNVESNTAFLSIAKMFGENQCVIFATFFLKFEKIVRQACS